MRGNPLVRTDPSGMIAIAFDISLNLTFEGLGRIDFALPYAGATSGKPPSVVAEDVRKHGEHSGDLILGYSAEYWNSNGGRGDLTSTPFGMNMQPGSQGSTGMTELLGSIAAQVVATTIGLGIQHGELGRTSNENAVDLPVMLVGWFVTASGVELIAVGFEIASFGLALVPVTGGVSLLGVAGGVALVALGSAQVGVGLNILAVGGGTPPPFPGLPGGR